MIVSSFFMIFSNLLSLFLIIHSLIIEYTHTHHFIKVNNFFHSAVIMNVKYLQFVIMLHINVLLSYAC